ncbi:MAG TPA: hypothetical protein VK990_02435, partial [Acidimicrobiia bacterium]|nr:hypothetical protein [Acidimicrobiia bacterium]
TALMPAGVPLPAAEEGTRVFVEWVRASTVEETAPLDYRVTVLARSLAARSDEVYQRQAPLELTVEITLVDGTPQVVAPPQVRSASAGPASEMTLGTVPEQVGAAALELAGGTDVIGGVQAPDGGWRVVVLVTTPDGVSRPVSISPPAP